MEAGSVQPAPEGAPEGAPQEPGQGAPAETPGLYAEVLEGIPEEFHESLTERLKGMDAKATQRFQTLSERSKPYEEAGVFDAEPENLQGWLNLSTAIEAAQSGDEKAVEAVGEWVEQLEEALGLSGGGETGESGDGEAQDLLDLTPQQLQEMMQNQVAQATNPLVEKLEEAEKQQALNEAKEELGQKVQELREANPGLTDDDIDDIYGLAYLFGQDADDPISAGFERFKRVAGRGENNLFQEKLNQPAPAEPGGTPNTAAPVPNSDNAKELALERLKAMQAT